MKSFKQYLYLNEEGISSREALKVHFDLPDDQIPESEEEAKELFARIADQNYEEYKKRQKKNKGK